MSDDRFKSSLDSGATTGLDKEKPDEEPSCQGAGSKEHLVPRHCTLDGFAEEAVRHGGVDISQLEPLTRLYVQTQNTLYQLTWLDPWESKIMIQGGQVFAQPTKASLCGSSFGGSFLKSKWIGRFMRMEVYAGGRNIVTSPVRSVKTEDSSNLPGPF